MSTMKPKFLECPSRYTRTPRTSQTDVQRGYAIERCTPLHRSDRIVVWGCAVSVVIVLIAITFGVIQ